MLILKRKLGEKIIIGDRLIEIEIIELGRTMARLAFKAPDDVSIQREEVYEAIRAEQRRLTSGGSPG